MIGTAVAVTALGGAAGGLATAASVAGALAREAPDDGAGVILLEAGAEGTRRPTLVSSRAARALEERLRGELRSAARGAVCWAAVPDGADLAEALELCLSTDARVVVYASPSAWRELVDAGLVGSAVIRADTADAPAQRSLAALACRDLMARGVATKIVTRAPGLVATRRALAGIEPGGFLGRRSGTIARRLSAQSGQAMPLVLFMALAVVVAGVVLALLSVAASGAGRFQRAADLAAVSAARSMRDDHARLFVPATLPGGAPNPAHLADGEYRARATDAANEALEANGFGDVSADVSFPVLGFAPTRVSVELEATPEVEGEVTDGGKVEVSASAEAYPVVTAASGGTAVAEGGGYSGSLEVRQGEGMRPDVARAFDAMASAALAAGYPLTVNSGFRSDAEQAALFAANPDPRMVAPPGTSLHRCGTELDLGPSSAYGWLAQNAGRFGFVQRYSWEAWHYGFTQGPAPCSAAAESGAATRQSDGESSAGSLPSFVPARFRDAITRSASRWNVPAALLAAQIMAESNFNPFAVSPAGASGIAQFMPGTAAAYGLDDPTDADAAIDAQGHLMSDLLGQFAGQTELALAAYNAGPAPVLACDCVPGYPETQAYVARILGLLGGAGAIAPPELEVRLVG